MPKYTFQNGGKMTRDTFDSWRGAYDILSFRQQQTFYNDIQKQFPQKPCYKTLHTMLKTFLKEHPEVRIVMELGGYDGSLANEIIPNTSIYVWDNFEIIQDLPQKCTLSAYNYVSLKKHFWDLTKLWSVDVFVASHVFEHLKLRDIEKIAAIIKAKWVFIEVPIPDVDKPEWTQFNGTHVIDGSISDIADLFVKQGFGFVQWGNGILVMRRDS